MININVRRDTPPADIAGKVSEAAARAMEDGAADIVRAARLRLTANGAGGGQGMLARSVEAEAGRDAMEWTVRAGAPYARFVELGTRRMAARPFLLPALRAVWPRIVARLRQSVSGDGS